jgi:uncharacterized membrane protein YbaN (DUF454 family)
MQEKHLSLALRVIGLVYIFGLYPMVQWLMTAAWSWEPRQPEYEQMILGVYATLGVFLFLAAKEPSKHASLIWFTISSNIVHAGIMLVQALRDPVERPKLHGDVPALFLVAAVLWYLMATTQTTKQAA